MPPYCKDSGCKQKASLKLPEHAQSDFQISIFCDEKCSWKACGIDVPLVPSFYECPGQGSFVSPYFSSELRG